MSASSACHDPYREVELYLEKAQEEIGKAFEELLQQGGAFDSSNGSKWSHCEPLLPPPPAFRTPAALPAPLRTSSKLTSAPVDQTSRATLTRVCYDGNVLDLAGSFKSRSPPHPLRKAHSSPPSGSFFSKIGANIVVQNGDVVKDGNVICSPVTRRKIMQLRPCLSLPEGYNGVNAHEPVTLTNNRSLIDQNIKRETTSCNLSGKGTTDSFNSDNNFLHLFSPEEGRRRMRQRSFSEVSPPVLKTVTLEEQYHTFPRPPSGDVNLLSIWADNLVLEIDRSMSGDLYGSGASSSPSSASSLSPTKQDNEDSEVGHSNLSSKGNKNHHVRKTKSSKDGMNGRKYGKLPLPFSSGNKGSKPIYDLQVICPSPDSGIDQIGCETPEVSEGAVSSTSSPQAGKTKDSQLVQPPHNLSQRDETDVQVNESIAPPPPEFEDNHNPESNDAAEDESSLKGERICKNSSMLVAGDKGTTEEKSATKRLLMAANSVLLMYEPVTLQDYDNREMNRLARVIPKASVELEDCATVASTTCVLTGPDGNKEELMVSTERNNCEAQERKTNVSLDSTMSSSSNKPSGGGSNDETEEDDDVFESESSTENKTTNSATCTLTENVLKTSRMPKNIDRIKALERWSNSLPRDAGRNIPMEMEPVQCPQRSSSSSAVSNISQVSMDELAAFMRKVKSSTYHPPPRADVCVGAKDIDTGMEDGDDQEQNRDAVTQTTPVLSRSSSFTWVTECDCSDWDSSNLRSGSDDSLLIFSCSNCPSEKKANLSQSSTSSPVISSEEEDLRRQSECSSLSLSACSERSEESRHSGSPEKNAAAPGSAITVTETQDSVDGTVSSESTERLLDDAASSRNSKIGSSSEEKHIGETVSLISALESVAIDPQGQSASFPSTLKASSKKPKAHPPPIEPHVLISELNVKSASAPMLRPHRHLAAKREGSSSTQSSPPTAARAAGGGPSKEKTSSPSRAHSAKELNELQAIEACSWLRAAGFPQYAQMYEDNLFPIDICTVQKDHAFLHPDSIQSLFRRLNTLNRCARMKFIDNIPRKSLHVDESDDEEQCALSENWQFQRTSRRWSRVPSPPEGLTESGTCGHDPPSPKPYLYPPSSPMRKFLSPEEAYCSSHDSVFIDEQQSSPDSIRRSTGGTDERYHVTPYHRGGGGGSPGSSSGSGGTPSCGSEDVLEKALDVHQRNLRRSGSDRIKEGAKALLRRMESLKGKRKKKNQETGNTDTMHDITMSMPANSGTDGSSSSSMTPSPQLSRSLRVRGESPQDISDCSQGSTPLVKHRKKGWGVLCKGDADTNAHSDSECPVLLVSERWKDANCNDTKLIEHYVTSQASVTITSSRADQDWHANSHNDKTSAQDHNSCYTNLLRQNQQETKKTNWLHPNFDPNQDEEEEEGEKRGSYYDNLPAPLVVFNRTCVENLEKDNIQKDIGSSHNTSRLASDPEAGEGQDEGEIIIINGERRDSGVGSSLTRGSSHQQVPWHCFPNRPSPSPIQCPSKSPKSIPVTSLTAPQVLVLRKLSLLKLTTLMEKFSPSSRTGWSWAVPKFIRRIRTPDYKDKAVFGVPLLLILQRTGQPLPVSIQAAIHYLRKTALDSTGLFRKSGVRSRIQKLRNLNESNPDKICYDDQQAYDVADMLKQYFRELPEALLTNKLSETFISIYQYIPEELRLEAIQAAILLMPDENREVLQSLLFFLQEVCQHAGENQMTATNLAVCFAPSLFHLSTPRSASASPRRRKTVGVPDIRELNENKAAYECLSGMVLNYKQLFSLSEEMVSQCHLSCMGDYEPATLEELSTIINRGHCGWKAYIDSCIQVLLKEAKDKYKGWVTVGQFDNVDLAYRKVGDGHPLRLWKVVTEVEAPPVELLSRILRERHVWDSSFLKWRVVNRLDKQTEVFQYISSSLSSHPTCDYCILRSWKTDLPKGACVLVEASVEHTDAPLMVDGVRAVVLASRYLIEPCGSGKSRITHISRVDTRGRSPEWYNRAYGHICTLQLTRLRDSFHHSIQAEGPETKV